MVGCVSLALISSLVVLVGVGASFPTIVSPGLLALSFGLRHAVDADHIAAIDNVTRKLVEDNQQPLLVGLFFSLGHSTVVIVMCLLVAWSSGYAAGRIPDFARFAGLWGASFSSCVLFLFGVFNGCAAWRLWRQWRRLRALDRAGGVAEMVHTHDGETRHTHVVSVVADDDIRVEGPGFLTKSVCCRRIFASIDRSWKLYPVGVLFGLGFDTATEVSLLAVTITAAGELPWAVTLVLPLLFTCGMSFIDTLDGIFMLWAYGWAGLSKVLQVWFSFSLTAVSAFIAFVIAFIQVLGILHEELELSGPAWDPVVALGEHSDVVGGCIVAFFVMSLAAAALFARSFQFQGAGERQELGSSSTGGSEIKLTSQHKNEKQDDGVEEGFSL